MHRSRATISLLVAAVVFFAAVSPALGATSSDIKKHQDAAENARKQAEQAEAIAAKLAEEISALSTEIKRLEDSARALEPQIATATERTSRIQQEVDQLQAEIDATEAEIDATEKEYSTQQGLLAERVNSAYRQGSWHLFELLLESKDISDFVARTEFVNRVIKSNNDAATSLKLTAESLSRAKTKLDRSLNSVEIKRQEAAQVEQGLRDLKNDRDRAARQRETAQNQKSKLMAESKDSAKRLRALAEAEEAESVRIAAELSGKDGSGIYVGTMAWPVPSSRRVTSYFGYRTHPIFGDRRLHTGLDIGASQGSVIVAAGSGTVIYTGYRGGYGNTVMIDHGNGVVSLYAHQANGSIMVQTGQKVASGEQIGKVGSTGNSTGPHLHFEVRVNGTPKNPLNYL